MFTYAQKEGTLRRNGALIGIGYSGAMPDGKNNPSMQAAHNVGPIPQGYWLVTELLPEYPPHGPFVLRLAAKEGTETFGRDGFLMHGDMVNPALAGRASEGCIIMPRSVREEVWASGDRDLQVIASDVSTTL